MIITKLLGCRSNASNACSSRASSRSRLNLQATRGPGRGTNSQAVSDAIFDCFPPDLSEARKEVGAIPKLRFPLGR